MKDKIIASKQTKKYYLEFGLFEENFKKKYHITLERIQDKNLNGEITEAEIIFCMIFDKERKVRKIFTEILEGLIR